MNDSDKKTYEVSFLSKSENGGAAMVGHITRFGAEISNEGKLRKVQLAYPINKHESAFFGSINCKLPTDSVSKINDSVKLDEEIMRILIVEPQTHKDTVPSAGREGPGYEPTPQESKEPTAKKKDADEARLSNELLEEKLEEILQ